MPCTEDATKEECEEGYTIQLDGLRREWNWQGFPTLQRHTVQPAHLSFSQVELHS